MIFRGQPDVDTQAEISSDPEKSLGVFVAKQEPNVRCYGNARVMAIVNSCYTIFDTMPIDENVLSFGNGGQVQLPWTQQAGKTFRPWKCSGHSADHGHCSGWEMLHDSERHRCSRLQHVVDDMGERGDNCQYVRSTRKEGFVDRTWYASLCHTSYNDYVNNRASYQEIVAAYTSKLERSTPQQTPPLELRCLRAVKTQSIYLLDQICCGNADLKSRHFDP